MIPAGVEPRSMGKEIFGIEILLKLANLIRYGQAWPAKQIFI